MTTRNAVESSSSLERLRFWRWRGYGPDKGRHGFAVAESIEEAGGLVTRLAGPRHFYFTCLPWPEGLPRKKPFALEQRRGR